jgi:hypothetical protein
MATTGGDRTSTCTAGTGALPQCVGPAVWLCMCGRAAPAPQVEVRRGHLSGLSPRVPLYSRLGALMLSGYH